MKFVMIVVLTLAVLAIDAAMLWGLYQRGYHDALHDSLTEVHHVYACGTKTKECGVWEITVSATHI